MKVLCKHCLNSCKKAGKIDCEKYKPKANIEELRIEREKLLVSKSNPEKLEEIIKQINYFDYGFK